VAHDVDRRDWRTFRLDRTSALETIGTTFTFDDPPDAVELVRRGLRVRIWPYEARLRVNASLDDVTQMIPTALAAVGSTGSWTTVDVGSLSLERMVRYLAGLPVACEVLDPPELRTALRRHAERVVAANT
jgi:predicted DNA-binding transcriptional regulator YafY